MAAKENTARAAASTVGAALAPELGRGEDAAGLPPLPPLEAGEDGGEEEGEGDAEGELEGAAEEDDDLEAALMSTFWPKPQ